MLFTVAGTSMTPRFSTTEAFAPKLQGCRMLPPIPFSMGPLSVGTLPSTPCTRAEAPVSTVSANVPPVMAPLQVTGSSTALFPALKVAFASTMMLWMLSASCPMVSGASASSSSFRSTVPVMVSTPFSSLKPLNTPPVTEPS